MTVTPSPSIADLRNAAVSSVVTEDELNRLGEEFSARCRQGESPSVDEFANRYDDQQRDEVREFLESVALLEDLRNDAAASSPSMMALPEQFGRYQIEKALGEGGMGAVYLAHDHQLDRKVALKTPKFGRHFDDHLVERFYREARAAATLQHPNICPVYDVGELNGIHYISMAYIEGRPLSDYIQPARLPSVHSTLRIIRRLALALQEAHQVGLIHRDLKPANIMIGRRNEPIVMDFGLARHFDSDDGPDLSTDNAARLSQQIVESRLTLDGTVVGSPGYMAPEQLLGDQPRIGPASDVYALGVLMFELLTGRLPFPGSGNLMSIVSAVISDDVPDAAAFRSEVDRAVSQVCRRAMAKRISDRYESMAEFAVAVTALLKSAAGSSSGTTTDLPANSTVQHVRQREQADLAKSLYKEGQYAAAASILEKMTVGSDPHSSELTRWAQSELPRYRAQAEAADSGLTYTSQLDRPWHDEAQSDAFEAIATTDYSATTTRENRRSRRKPKSKRIARLRKAAIVVVLLTLVAAVGKRWRKASEEQFVGNLTTALRQTDDASLAIESDAAADHSASGATELQKETSQTDIDDGSVVSNSNAADDRAVAADGRDVATRPLRPRSMAAMRKSLNDRLWRLDVNENDRLSRQEMMVPWMQQFPVLRRMLESFDRFDVPPRDGELDHMEVQRMLRQLPRPGDPRNTNRRREP